MAKKQSFENSMERLEEIVRKLEKGDSTLSENVTLFEEGTKLAAALRKQLDEAEQKVSIVKETAKGVEELPFPAPETEVKTVEGVRKLHDGSEQKLSITLGPEELPFT